MRRLKNFCIMLAMARFAGFPNLFPVDWNDNEPLRLFRRQMNETCSCPQIPVKGPTMNSQRRRVIIASLAGLALAVAFNAAGLINTTDITPPALDTSGPFNSGYANGYVVGHRAGALFFFPLIFIIIVLAVTARKAGLRNTIFNGLGAIVGIYFVCAVIAVATAHPSKELPYADAGAGRADFVRGATDGCARQQQALLENKVLSAEAVDAICSCAANSTADVITRTEIAYRQQHQTPAPSLVEKAKTIVQKCVRLVENQL